MSKSSSNENLSLVQPEEQGSEFSGSDCDEVTQKFNHKLNEAEEKKLLDSKTRNLIEKYTPDVTVHTGSKGILPKHFLKLSSKNVLTFEYI